MAQVFGMALGRIWSGNGSPKPATSTGSSTCTSGTTASFTATGGRATDAGPGHDETSPYLSGGEPRFCFAPRSPFPGNQPAAPCPEGSMMLKAPFQLPAGFLVAFGYRGRRRFVAFWWEPCGDASCI